MEAEQENLSSKGGLGRNAVFRALLICLPIISIIIYFFLREPRYQGKTLTAWLDQFTPTEPGLVGVAAGQQNRAAREAITHIGDRAVPLLIHYLKPSSRPEFVEKIDLWLDENFDMPFSLPGGKDRRFEALTALQILGPAAKPAITNIAGMLADARYGGFAASCLASIGPVTIPELTNALASADAQTRASALEGLCLLGPEARAAAPSIASMVQDSRPGIGEIAILVLGGFGSQAEPYLPVIDQSLRSGKYPEAAALALAYLGKTECLLEALTNSNQTVKTCAAVVLNPQFALKEIAPVNFVPTGHNEKDLLHLLFQMKNTMSGLPFGERPAPLAPLRLTDLLLAHLNDPDPAARSFIADQLGNQGIFAATSLPALTNALSDTNESVRQNAAAAMKKIGVIVSEGGIIRGPVKEKRIALEFTGHTFAEGGTTILDELARHHAHASFFVTGDFMTHREFMPLIKRIVEEGHYLGPHSDKHLLYCPWDGPKKTLVSHDVFENDLGLNKLKVMHSADGYVPVDFWLPAYEWYNEEIVEWGHSLDLMLVNYTPGTRSNADYTGESDKNFVSSQAIFDSIVKREREDPNGLNGYLLLMHLGAGQGRKDKMHDHLGALLDHLSGKGYEFVRIDELLK